MGDLEQRNLAAAAKMYEIAGAGDWTTAATLITPDFFVTEATTVPFAGRYEGIEGYRRLFTTLTSVINVTGFDLHQMTAGGDWVVVLLDIVAQDERGAPLPIPLAESLRFRDGLCCEIKPYYFDPALVHRAVAAKKALA